MPNTRKIIRKVQISLGEGAILPKKGSDGAAGFDLYTPVDVTIQPNSSEKVDIKISLAIPTSWYGKIYDRSSIALQGVTVLAGVIDADYRGTVCVVLRNLTDTPKTFEKGTRIAQLIITRYLDSELSEVPYEDLGKTKRGRGGFGSTGRTKIVPPRDMSPERSSSNSN